MRGRRKAGTRIRLIAAAALMLFAAAFFGGLTFVRYVVEPNMEGAARIKAEALVSRTISRALSDQFRDRENESLFRVEKGSDGSMELVQADSVKINIFMSEFSANLQEAFQDMEGEKLRLPAGALLGSKILSQTGPFVELLIMPLSVSSADFRTEFETQGINQTKYKIYMILECRVRVIAPFSSKVFTTENTVLIGETVILGKVPDSYVQVPEEDILDVT